MKNYPVLRPIEWDFPRFNIPQSPKFIPWEMILSHAQRAVANHGQSLVRLAERGGLTPCEILAILDDKGYESIDPGEAIRLLKERISLWTVQMK